MYLYLKLYTMYSNNNNFPSKQYFNVLLFQKNEMLLQICWNK